MPKDFRQWILFHRGNGVSLVSGAFMSERASTSHKLENLPIIIRYLIEQYVHTHDADIHREIERLTGELAELRIGLKKTE